MKTLKLSALAAFVLLFVSSCTRDTDSLTSASSASLFSVQGNGRNPNGEENGGGPAAGTPATPAEGDEEEEEDPNKLSPVMTITYSSNPATVNKSLTITASFLSTVTPPPCGKLVLEQMGDDPATLDKVEDWFSIYEEAVTAGDQTLIYTFTPTVAGNPAYTFRAHYKANTGGGPSGQCAGYKNSHSEGFPLEVKEACDVNTLTVTSRAVAEDLKDGNYKFTITYTLKSPEAMENIHFQGGATSGGKEQHALVTKGDMEVLHNNNQNTVLYWDGSLKACEPVTLSFSYIRKFSCPEGNNAVVTGDWSVIGGGLLEPKPVNPVVFDCQNVIRN